RRNNRANPNVIPEKAVKINFKSRIGLNRTRLADMLYTPKGLTETIPPQPSPCPSPSLLLAPEPPPPRSEERRVGKACTSRLSWEWHRAERERLKDSYYIH